MAILIATREPKSESDSMIQSSPNDSLSDKTTSGSDKDTSGEKPVKIENDENTPKRSTSSASYDLQDATVEAIKNLERSSNRQQVDHSTVQPEGNYKSSGSSSAAASSSSAPVANKPTPASSSSEQRNESDKRGGHNKRNRVGVGSEERNAAQEDPDSTFRRSSRDPRVKQEKLDPDDIYSHLLRYLKVFTKEPDIRAWHPDDLIETALSNFPISHGLLAALDQFFEETKGEPDRRQRMRLIFVRDLNSGVCDWSIEVVSAIEMQHVSDDLIPLSGDSPLLG